MRRRAFISRLGGAAVAWLLAAAGAADAQTVALRQLRTTGPTPVAIVEVTNQTPAAMQYALVECVLFDANHVAIDLRRAGIENIGAGGSAVGEVRFLSSNPMTGLSTMCRVADSVRADQAVAAAGPITVDVMRPRLPPDTSTPARARRDWRYFIARRRASPTSTPAAASAPSDTESERSARKRRLLPCARCDHMPTTRQKGTRWNFPADNFCT